MTGVDARTKLCCVIGHPIAHSLSPHIHNAALRHDGRDAVYLAFDATDVRATLAGLQAIGAVGCNVTIPHKEAAWAEVVERSAGAERIGAANTIVFGSAGPVAHNTDPDGIIGALAGLDAAPSGARCLVLGAGGAGRAAVWALASAGAAEVVVANRTEERAAEVARDLGARHVPWDDLGKEVSRAEIVVQATSVGMDGDGRVFGLGEIEGAAASGCRAVLDLVYVTGGTPLVRDALAAGIPAGDGLEVLVQQAGAAYRLFWGAEAPLEVMRQAALEAAGRGSPGPS